MTREQHKAVQDALGFAVAADADGVLRAIRALQYADRQRGNPTAVAQALTAMQALAKRLLRIEEDYATTRAAIARLEVANARGGDYNLRDLAAELERLGIDLKDDYDHADDLARAAESEAL
jgi:hypothetical protein